MKNLPLRIRLPLGIAMLIVVIIAGVIFFHQTDLWWSNEPWNPLLTAATVLVIWGFAQAAMVCVGDTGSAESLTRKLPRLVRVPIDILIWIAWWAASGVIVSRAVNWWTGATHPAGPAAVMGLVMGAGTLLMTVAYRREWIHGVFFRPNSLHEKREELARQREQILAQARRK